MKSVKFNAAGSGWWLAGGIICLFLIENWFKIFVAIGIIVLLCKI